MNITEKVHFKRIEPYNNVIEFLPSKNLRYPDEIFLAVFDKKFIGTQAFT